MFSILKKQSVSEYSEKVKYLLESGIALWDVLVSCKRLNSSDNNITKPIANDFASFFSWYKINKNGGI